MGPISFRDVQKTVSTQHEEIRARIEGLRRNAERADLLWAARALRPLLLRFAAEFDAHLGYEERELLPRIRHLDAWGEAREAALRVEHRDQRERLERACALAEDDVAMETELLCDGVLDLADSLLADMKTEEQLLEELAWIDEHGQVDQMTG